MHRQRSGGAVATAIGQGRTEFGRANRDPIGEGGGVNLFGFTRNDPANFVDTDGRWVIPVVAIGAGIIVGGCAVLTQRLLQNNADSLEDGECVTIKLPNCMKLIFMVGGMLGMPGLTPGTPGATICRDCNGKVTVTLIQFDPTGYYGGSGGAT